MNSFSVDGLLFKPPLKYTQEFFSTELLLSTKIITITKIIAQLNGHSIALSVITNC